MGNTTSLDQCQNLVSTASLKVEAWLTRPFPQKAWIISLLIILGVSAHCSLYAPVRNTLIRMALPPSSLINLALWKFSTRARFLRRLG